jgi:hypothetical protein
VPATLNIGSTVDIVISGNVTSSQMSNVEIATDQSVAKTTVSFTVTGESGNIGFGNITIPKTAVAYGTTPTIYIDNQAAANQGFTQDANNYYVWYTTHFSTHQVSIVFTGGASAQGFPLWIVLTVVAVGVVCVATVVLVSKRKKQKGV